VRSVGDRGSSFRGVAGGLCRRSELRNERWRRIWLGGIVVMV